MNGGVYIGITKIAYPQYKGYNEFLLDDGTKVYLDKKTGEAVQCATVDVPTGSVVTTPRQLEVQTAYKERQETKRQQRIVNTDLSFYFALSEDRRSDGIKPQTLARVFFLATYLNFGDDRLYASNGNLLVKSDLSKLMKLKRKTFDRFWNEVEGRYIFERKDGLAMTGEFFRGALSGLTDGRENANGYQQIFIKTLRELYWQTPLAKHRYLGYLFMILPKISWEYNILCENPDELNREKVKPISLDQFCENIGCKGYVSNQRGRLLDAYRELSFEYQGVRQNMCAYLHDHIGKLDYFVVNPNVIYRGSDRRKVDGFGLFFPSLLDKNVRGKK